MDVKSSSEYMQDRVARLSEVLGEPLFESTLWGHEYKLDNLDADLRKRISERRFRKFVFYGMGCSSVVSDIVKGFFLTTGVDIDVEVINDYETEWFVTDRTLAAEDTLVFIVCYSGWSVEPCLFYDRMKQLNGAKNLIVLTGGGRIAKLAKEDGNSVIEYQLRHADREYPLYHVQQFFSIFLDIFYRLGVINRDYTPDLRDAVDYLKETFDNDLIARAKEMAYGLRDSRIVFLATARWYTQLLKQTTMFFNEIAMVPSHRNMLHEYSHTEVAAYSDPRQKQSIVILLDVDDDDYTKNKVATLEKLFGDCEVPQNRNISIWRVDLDQDSFFKKFYYAHFFMVYVAFFLGKISNVEGRDLISIAAKNPWWSQESICEHPKCVDIPGDLSDDIRRSIEIV